MMRIKTFEEWVGEKPKVVPAPQKVTKSNKCESCGAKDFTIKNGEKVCNYCGSKI